MEFCFSISSDDGGVFRIDLMCYRKVKITKCIFMICRGVNGAGWDGVVKILRTTYMGRVPNLIIQNRTAWNGYPHRTEPKRSRYPRFGSRLPAFYRVFDVHKIYILENKVIL